MTSNNTSLSSLSNETEICGAVLKTDWERTAATTANVLVMLVALVGNSLILVVVINSKNMKNTTDIFIANMAFSDLVFPLLVIPRKITEIYFGERRWLINGTAGLVFCKTLFFLQDLSTAVSIFSLILITLDRFYAIVLPFKRFLITKKSCIIIVLITWALGIAIHGVYFEIFTLVPNANDDLVYCDLRWDLATIKFYYISLFVCLFVTPFILMTSVYSIIFSRLLYQKNRIGVSLSDPQNTQRSIRQRKVLYLAFAIVVSFTIAWAPLNIVVFLDFFFHDHSDIGQCSWNTLFFVGMFLAYASSAVNPIITFLFSSKFRMASKELVSRIGRQYVHKNNQVTNITHLEMH